MIGANSLVVGSHPAKQSRGGLAGQGRSAPRPPFPRSLTEDDRAAMVHEMMSEFDRYVVYSDTTIAGEGPVRTYTRDDRGWTLRWVAAGAATWRPGQRRSGVTRSSPKMPLTEPSRRRCASAGCHGSTSAGRTRSESRHPAHRGTGALPRTLRRSDWRATSPVAGVAASGRYRPSPPHPTAGGPHEPRRAARRSARRAARRRRARFPRSRRPRRD